MWLLTTITLLKVNDQQRRTVQKLKRSPYVVAGGVTFAILVLLAVVGPLIWSVDPNVVGRTQFLPPNLGHPFGTDDLGRDVLSRVLYGARVSLSVGLASVSLAVAIGLPSGLVAGYYGGKIDMIIMRVMDGLFAFPSLLLALAIVAVLGAGIQNLIVTIGAVYSPGIARIMRGSVVSTREKLFIPATVALGARNRHVILRHVLPNSATAVIIQATLQLGFAIMIEAALSFLGVGIPPPAPSWGRMINDARGYLQVAPLLLFIPGAFLTATVLGINLLGIGLTEAWNPRAAGEEARN
jgi:peptide/nickel transport system permease protein